MYDIKSKKKLHMAPISKENATYTRTCVLVPLHKAETGLLKVSFFLEKLAKNLIRDWGILLI